MDARGVKDSLGLEDAGRRRRKIGLDGSSSLCEHRQASPSRHDC